jgi:hypothetical protein
MVGVVGSSPIAPTNNLGRISHFCFRSNRLRAVFSFTYGVTMTRPAIGAGLPLFVICHQVQARLFESSLQMLASVMQLVRQPMVRSHLA